MKREYIIFNRKTGEFRSSNTKEGKAVETLVANFPKSSCKKCHGRGYVGIGKKSGLMEPCNCVLKKSSKN